MLKDWVAGIVALLLLFIGLFFLLFTFALVLFLPFAIGYFIVSYLMLKTLNKKERVGKRLFWLGSAMVLLFIILFIYFAGLPIGVPCGEWSSFEGYDQDCECVGIMTGHCPLGSLCEGGKFGCIGICQNCVTKMDYRQLSECRFAASQCRNILARNPSGPCALCDSACIHANGSEVFPGAIDCCKLGSEGSMNMFATSCQTNATQAQACVQTGGNVTVKSCCSYTQDFRNNCMENCDCAPENSHTVKYCDCGPERCWDSSKNSCVLSNPPRPNGVPCDKSTDCISGACLLVNASRTTNRGECVDVVMHPPGQYIDENGTIGEFILVD